MLSRKINEIEAVYIKVISVIILLPIYKIGVEVSSFDTSYLIGSDDSTL